MDRLKEFKKIMEKSESDKVTLITNHYQITGYVYDCEECNKDNFINLTNATLCLLNDSYSEKWDRYKSSRYNWHNINIDRIVAFSFSK